MSVKKININQTGTTYDITSDVGYLYAGVATPTTDPGTPDGKVVYFANTAGVYTHFDNITVEENQVVALYNINGSWESHEITNNTVTTDKIVDGAVTTEKLADSAMSQAMNTAIIDEKNRAEAAEQANADAIAAEVVRAKTAEIELNKIKEDGSGDFVIADRIGNIHTRFSKSGLETTKIILKSDKGNDVTIDENTTLTTNNMFSAFKKQINTSNKNTLYLVDIDGNIILKVDKRGIYTTLVKTKAIRSDEKAMYICDSYGNILLQFEETGLKTTAVNSEYIEAISSKITNLDVETINGNKFQSRIVSKNSEDVEDNFETDFVGALMYGQSLGNACFSGPTVSNTCPYRNLFSFIGGVRTYDSYYLNSSGHPEGHTGKAPWVTRKGDVRYGEMIDYKNTLSAIDIEAIEYSYSELIPLVEKILKYSAYTNSDNPDIGYKADMEGTIDMRHVAGEVPISGILEAFDNLLVQEDGYNVDGRLVNFIAECPDFGSATFGSMLPINTGGKIHIEAGTIDATNLNYFELLSLDVYKAKEYCDSIGKTYSVGAIFYYHEGDWGSNYHYINKSARLRLFSRINQRIKEITGQNNDVLFFMHQGHMSESHNRIDYELAIETEADIYTEEQEAAMKESFDSIKPTDGVSLYDTPEYDKKNVFLGQPIYGYKYVDGTHLTSIESKKHGAAMGYAYKRTLIDGKSWLPIHPISHKITRVTIDGVAYYKTSLKFHVEVSPLVLDEDAVNGIKTSPSAQARGDKYGFIFSTADGILKGHSDDGTDFIKKIEIAKSNTINFYTIENTQSMQLHYAYDFIVADNSYLLVLSKYKRPIGNLRDSRGDFYKIKINDEIGYAPIHNWSPSFNYVLN